ncbi:hypothetical protein IT774_07825 [Salinimonas marina]|uniref:Uncharacterized protein n=1 Tax=Salinimonas marina TaxID=2785918 RepID=A0A7S9DZV9_9ALTE|nr:hypothetical protein [Salinimonas marina]QPG07003.1 hypothetical protein IT774_07825 [Salinimonas marina]
MPAKPKITEEMQFRIEKMLWVWEGRLTWALLTQKINIELGLKITRQTLEDYKGIYNAYRTKKKSLRGATPQIEKAITKKDVDLVLQVKKLQADVDIRNKIINEQKRFLQRILQNAAEIPAFKGNIDLLIAERPEDKL